MNREQLEELLFASAAGDLNDDDRIRLNDALRLDREARAFAASFLVTDALLTDALETCLAERSFTPRPQPWLRVGWISAAAAAVVMLAALAGVLFVGQEQAVAVLAGEELRIGRVLTVDEGEAKIRFYSDALLAVQAPAKLEILGSNAARLHYGVATVRVPGPIKGFELLTPAEKVVDLGTSFGVTVERSGNTAVTVFEGEVAVGSDNAPERIAAGRAVRMNKGRGLANEEMSYNTRPFQRTWESSFGIEALQGQIRFAQPSERKSPGKVVDRDSLLLIPEREGAWLPVTLPLNIVEPGTHTVPYYRKGAVAPKGRSSANEIALPEPRQVDSYLLQYNPGAPTSKNKPFVSEVQFDREVIGIIGQKDLLAESDSTLALPGADFWGQRNRGVGENDRIILSPDRRKIRVVFDIEDGVDQIRVLVASHLTNRSN